MAHIRIGKPGWAYDEVPPRFTAAHAVPPCPPHRRAKAVANQRRLLWPAAAPDEEQCPHPIQLIWTRRHHEQGRKRRLLSRSREQWQLATIALAWKEIRARVSLLHLPIDTRPWIRSWGIRWGKGAGRRPKRFFVLTTTIATTTTTINHALLRHRTVYYPLLLSPLPIVIPLLRCQDFPSPN